MGAVGVVNTLGVSFAALIITAGALILTARGQRRQAARDDDGDRQEREARLLDDNRQLRDELRDCKQERRQYQRERDDLMRRLLGLTDNKETP